MGWAATARAGFVGADNGSCLDGEGHCTVGLNEPGEARFGKFPVEGEAGAGGDISGTGGGGDETGSPWAGTTADPA